MSPENKRGIQRARYVAAGFILAVMLMGATNLAAQSPSYNPDLQRMFAGYWRLAPNGAGFDEAKECGEIMIFNKHLIRCTFPYSKLKEYLHPRELAWMQFGGNTDETLSTKWECVPTPLPSIEEDGWTFVWPSNDELRMEYGFTSGGWIRHVYMDGRKHPTGYDRLSYMGHSIGWFEGNDLIIEATNFTFDPDGLDDHLHLATSPRKKLTERFKQTAPDKITMTLTVEDSLFLKRPFTWSFQLMKGDVNTAQPPLACDKEASYAELELIEQHKYEGK